MRSRAPVRGAALGRVLLGLRLDEPLSLDGLEGAVDPASVERLERLGLVQRRGGGRGARSDRARPIPGRRRHGGRFSPKIPAKKWRRRADIELNERQRAILRGVVEEYVATRQPVGSRTLVEQTRLSVSASTVRTELAALERLGLLTHPHTPPGEFRPSAATATTRIACSSDSSRSRAVSRST